MKLLEVLDCTVEIPLTGHRSGRIVVESNAFIAKPYFIRPG